MKVVIANREGTQVRYFVYDDSGRELRQTDRDCSKEIARAKDKHKSLEAVLVEVESK